MLKELNKSLSETTGVKTGRYQLILYNDAVHTFDFVIDTLMVVCGHSYHQAAQCALMTHHKGKCGVREGALLELAPLREALREKNLIAKIENL